MLQVKEKTRFFDNQVYNQIRFQGPLETEYSLLNLINYLEVYFLLARSVSFHTSESDLKWHHNCGCITPVLSWMAEQVNLSASISLCLN